MLTKKQCSVAARALFTAYCRYRNRSIESIAQECSIEVHRTGTRPLNGCIGDPVPHPDMSEEEVRALPRKVMTVPMAGPELHVEFVFWHELAHDILLQTSLPKKPEHIFPLTDPDATYDTDDWPIEWLCDKYAYLMVMHRAGIELLQATSNQYEAFFTPDKVLIKEMQRDSSRHVLTVQMCADIHNQLGKYTLPAATVARLSSLALLLVELPAN